MQTVSSTFTANTSKPLREISWRLLMSFEKNYDPSIDFFTIGTSTIGGTDILKGVNDVVQEWDKFDYADLTDRVLSIEFNREVDPPLSSLTLTTAQITLDNHDDVFTPGNASSPYDGFIQPRRPMRFHIGMRAEPIPMFIGVTDGMPEVNESSKTVRFNCFDFLSSIIQKPLDTELMYTNKRTDEVISSLLQSAGLLTTQFVLDTGAVVIPFAYFEKGSKLQDAITAISEAELGNVSCDENGVIRFQNRTNWATNSNVWNFTKDNVLDIDTVTDNDVINVVEVYSKARKVQAKQKIWELESAVEVKGSSTVEIFANFEDDNGTLPVTSVDTPVYISSATTSLFAVNTSSDGTGSIDSTHVTLTSHSLFSTAYKMVFTNTSTSSLFITQLELKGTPAKVVSDIYVRVQDDASVGIFDALDEHVFKVENNYIQDEVAANSIAQIIIEDRSEIDDQRKMQVRGVPQLQIGDAINYTDEIINEDYFVTRINGIMDTTAGFRQYLQVSKRTINTYFRIGISLIGGTDKISP